jgi:hypothetical protein
VFAEAQGELEKIIQLDLEISETQTTISQLSSL